MTTRNLVLTLLAVVFFCACKKHYNSDYTITRPEYIKHPLLVDEPVLYTSDGAHHDQQMIKDFITRNFRDHRDMYYFGQTTITDHNYYAGLTFTGNNKVKLFDMVMEIVSKTDKEMLLSPMDSTNMPRYDIPALRHCSMLYDQVSQYNPWSICNKAGGNCKKYRKVYPIIISGGDYYIPILNYSVWSTCSISMFMSVAIPQYLNKDITNGLLLNKDSVVVQTARLKVGEVKL